MLESEHEVDPYFPDALEKYFHRPSGEQFESCTYFEYFAQYNIVKSIRTMRLSGTIDGLGYHVVKRLKV